MTGRLRELQSLVEQLPEYLQDSIHSFPYEVRDQYRRRIGLAWLTSVGTMVLLGMLVWLTYRSIFRPLRVLIKGSRKVAAGRFDYRIRLDSHDEISELAAAMNQMSERFQTIRDDLDRQVQDRTRQVVRSEQLASVGFLAAGVAHEINTPLARIAACAKAIQQRLGLRSRDSEPQRRATAAQLRQIQDEAFRCKEITQSLLDFSRMGSAERQAVDLTELVRGMIDMLRHVGRYQGKQIDRAQPPVPRAGRSGRQRPGNRQAAGQRRRAGAYCQRQWPRHVGRRTGWSLRAVPAARAARHRAGPGHLGTHRQGPRWLHHGRQPRPRTGHAVPRLSPHDGLNAGGATWLPNQLRASSCYSLTTSHRSSSS
jgi:signal transduction histidine kinase